MYYILESGGKQYWASQGSILILPKLEAAVGEEISLKVIARISDNNVENESQSVQAEILKHSKSKKIIVFKKKRRKRYERKQGHRTKQTYVRIL